MQNMARLGVPQIFGDDEGYPTSREVDGIDTKRIANREGFNANLGQPLNCHREWRNSKTGKRMDPPDYAREDY